MYHTILVPLDGSSLAEAALDQAVQVAGNSCAVVLLRITEPMAVTVSSGTPLYSPDTMFAPGPLRPGPRALAEATDEADRQFQEAEAYLQTVAAALAGKVASVQRVVLAADDPADVIIDQARALPADLIVMATHGRSGVVRWVLGSVADRVLHNVPIPLLLVRPTLPRP